jgi:hypothetical protein
LQLSTARCGREVLRQVAVGGGGHSLELCCVLASFLLGAGYNALVVSGYASRPLCLHEQTRCRPYLPSPPRLQAGPSPAFACFNPSRHPPGTKTPPAALVPRVFISRGAKLSGHPIEFAPMGQLSALSRTLRLSAAFAALLYIYMLCCCLRPYFGISHP